MSRDISSADLSRDGTCDYDSDGLDDADEYAYDGDPTDTDTDGDGFSDSYEVASGTAVAEADDPDTLTLTYRLGDAVGASGSEKYVLTIANTRNAADKVCVTNTAFGVELTGDYDFVKGGSYEITLDHHDSDTNWPTVPHYDYQVYIEDEGGTTGWSFAPGFALCDTNGILGNHWEDEPTSTFDATNHTTMGDTGAQSTDCEVTVTAHILPTSLVGQAVYFRVVDPDPDDLSSYETNALPGDNSGGTSPEGTVSPAPDEVELSTIAGVTVAAAEAELQLVEPYAGNNYQAEGSLFSNFSSVCDTSAVLVAWKRVYVEKDDMYREGSDLLLDAGAGTAQVWLASSLIVTAGTDVVIFDADNPTGEVKTVTNMILNKIMLDSALTDSYSAGYGVGGRTDWDNNWSYLYVDTLESTVLLPDGRLVSHATGHELAHAFVLYAGFANHVDLGTADAGYVATTNHAADGLCLMDYGHLTNDAPEFCTNCIYWIRGYSDNL